MPIFIAVNSLFSPLAPNTHDRIKSEFNFTFICCEKKHAESRAGHKLFQCDPRLCVVVYFLYKFIYSLFLLVHLHDSRLCHTTSSRTGERERARCMCVMNNCQLQLSMWMEWEWSTSSGCNSDCLRLDSQRVFSSLSNFQLNASALHRYEGRKKKKKKKVCR